MVSSKDSKRKIIRGSLVSSKDSKRKITEVQWLVAKTARGK